MKILFISLLLTSFVSDDQGNLIPWKADRKLTWADFKAKPRQGTDNAALTSSNINFSFGYGTKGFSYSISCNFDKSRSWARVKTDYILAHEQAHFDIAEIHARKLNKALGEYKYSEKTVSDDVNSIYDRLMQEHHQMQLQYDRETNHSINQEKQKEWLKKVTTSLNSFTAYAKYK
jgi:Bacterial protein of unknown function (DUF922)